MVRSDVRSGIRFDAFHDISESLAYQDIVNLVPHWFRGALVQRRFSGVETTLWQLVLVNHVLVTTIFTSWQNTQIAYHFSLLSPKP